MGGVVHTNSTANAQDCAHARMTHSLGGLVPSEKGGATVSSSDSGPKKTRQRPTLPQSRPCSTIGPGGLNFRVLGWGGSFTRTAPLTHRTALMRA